MYHEIHIHNIIQQRKETQMKAKKAKEQLLAIALLSSVFVFFIYLKTNPEINVSSNNQNQVNKIINDKVQEINHEMTNAIDEEIVTEEIMAEENNQITKTEESIILFTERELKRAKAYIDKDWRPDETINMAAWDYVSKNPSINNSKDDNTSYSESNQFANTNIK